MKKIVSFSLAVFAASLISAIATDLPPKAALDAITADDLLGHIKVLASDKFEGRAPGSKGEDLTVDYISAAIQSTWPEARKSERHLHAGSSAGRNHHPSGCDVLGRRTRS